MAATVHETTTTSATHDPVRLRFENPDHHSKSNITTVPNPTNPRRTSIIIEERPRTNLTATFEDSDAFSHLLLPALSEFFGTLIYVLFTNLFGISGTSPIAKLGISIMDGAVLAALITALSPFGGLHFNPATTLGTMMTLNMRLIPGAVIIFIQFFAAFFGSLLSRAMLRSSTFLDAFVNLGIVDLPNSYPPVEESEHLQFSNRFQIYLMDSILTSFIVFVFLFSSTNSPTASVATSTGLARAVTAYISYQTIGQANNFARLLSNYVISSIFLSDNRVWRLFYLYIFGMITAPIIAAILYCVILIPILIYDSDSSKGNRKPESMEKKEIDSKTE